GTLVRARSMEILRYVAEERLCGCGSWSVPGQKLFEWNNAAIKLASAVVVLLHDGPIHGDAGEGATRARVGEDLRAHLPVSAALSVATNRTSSGGGVRTDLEFAGQELCHTVLVHHQH